MRRILLCVAASLFLSGCLNLYDSLLAQKHVTVNTTSVELVNQRKQGDSLESHYHSDVQLPEPGPLIQVTFTSTDDLKKMAEGRRMTVGSVAYRCASPDDPGLINKTKLYPGALRAYVDPYVGGGYIYDDFGPILYDRKEAHPEGASYRAYFGFVDWPLPLDKFTSYDLAQKKNLCVRISGSTELDMGNLLPDSFVSNTIFISADQLNEALALYRKNKAAK